LAVLHVKIGFLGGSFDPVHFGHLLAAQDAFEQHKLDRLIIVPAAQAPLKPNDVQSTAADRLAMLRAATEWDTRFEVSDFELSKGGVSYTIDSARHFRALYPNDELYWVIGGDQLPKLHLWKDIGELAASFEFIFLERPGYPVKAAPRCPGPQAAPVRRPFACDQLDGASRPHEPRAVARLFRSPQGDCLHPRKGAVSGQR
jgi:nicotinate-nucleotide adenylyltransferase